MTLQQAGQAPKPQRQRELLMDHTPALEAQMRAYFDARWRRWHRAGSFEVAMQDPVTHKCLCLAVMHLPQYPKSRQENRK